MTVECLEELEMISLRTLHVYFVDRDVVSLQVVETLNSADMDSCPTGRRVSSARLVVPCLDLNPPGTKPPFFFAFRFVVPDMVELLCW